MIGAKYLLLAFALAGHQLAIAVTFSNCTILSRYSSPSGQISKIYDCSNVGIRLTGTWDKKVDATGFPYFRAFGEFWNGERGNFGAVAASFVKHTFTKCTGGGSIGSEANFAGYMTERITYKCAEGEVKLEGQWGDEYQGHWNFHLLLGEVDMEPQFVDDVEKVIDFVSFQKYCKTKYGYRLCGWVEEPKVDHGKPPEFKRDAGEERKAREGK